MITPLFEAFACMSTILTIELNDVESRPLLSLATRLASNFRPNSQNDIYEAATLACYLYALQEVEASIKLLDSFLYFDYDEKPEKHRHLWVENCLGLLFLAYIQKKEGLPEIKFDLGYIMGRDSEVNAKRFMRGELRNHLRSNAGFHKLALTESPKHQCETYAQQVLNFATLKMLWPYYAKPFLLLGLRIVREKDLDGLLESNLSSLREALMQANKPREH